jgi:hypothetical protein
VTIRSSINARDLSGRLSHFEKVTSAPADQFEREREVARVIGATIDGFIQQMQALQLAIPNCDQAREVEAVLYGWVADANPDTFLPAEGFGKEKEYNA